MVEKSMNAFRIEDAIGTTMSVILVIFMGVAVAKLAAAVMRAKKSRDKGAIDHG
jgi:hypothetical protein